MINVKLIRTVWSFTNIIYYTSVEISNISVEISLPTFYCSRTPLNSWSIFNIFFTKSISFKKNKIKKKRSENKKGSCANTQIELGKISKINYTINPKAKRNHMN